MVRTLILASLFASPEKANSCNWFIVVAQFIQEEGQTLVEYGLLISLIALVVIGVLSLLGKKVKNTFNKAADSMNTST